MDEIKIDLSEHQFLDGISVFKQPAVEIKHKNFVFAKNGSGKSTFASIVDQELSKKFDVRIYNGFDTMLGENENLNAFALSVNANANEKLIEEKQKSLNTQNIELSRVLSEIGESSADDQDKKNLSKRLQEANKRVAEKQKVIEDFYTVSAAEIKNMSDPQISGTAYNKNNFKNEIRVAAKLQDDDISLLKETVKTDEKVAKCITWQELNLAGYLNSTNDILESKVEEKTRILRFNNDQDKINFAESGLKIHEHREGELCVFCGNPISKETFEELEAYFSADEVEQLKERIELGKKKISNLVADVHNISNESSDFYPDFRTKAVSLWDQVSVQKQEVIHFCEVLENSLSDKERNLFDKQEPVSISVPENVDVSEYNSLVEENNAFGKDLDKEKNEAKVKLRKSAIKRMLDDFHFDVKKSELGSMQEIRNNVQKEIHEKEQEKASIQNVIKSLENEIDALKPKAEKQAINHINQKLSGSVSWKLDYYEESDESGYYWVSQKCEDGRIAHRGVKELSTGEKNIIALLYFLEKLEETGEANDKLPKVILFDDPMNSNDAGMQYLIITELQKLYQGKFSKRYNPQKDYIVIMTHNVHFYLNVPPHGAFKDENGKTKYDKNNFYSIRRGHFIQIENEKQDFKTNYDALWSELQDLSENNLTNSMLNSMRRIIETYIEFTGISQNDFYKNNEQYLKLFNVNSHSAIDSVSAEAFTESSQELVASFHQIFKDNNAEAHFKSHWNVESK